AADLAQFLQVLPGVVFTGDQGGQLYIRGGTPIQNMVLLDDMIVYSPFHSIGLFSVFDPDYIRSVDVYSAGFPAAYGGRTSSVIDIKTRNGSFSRFKAKANINPFSAGALIEGPLGKAKKDGSGVSYLISARNNYIDQTGSTFYPYVNDSTGLPYSFLDIYGKLTLSDGVNYANLFGFSHTDDVNFEFPANINWEAAGGGANFQLLPAGASAIISGTFAYSNYTTGLTSQSENFPRRSSIQGFNGTLKVGYIFNSVDEFNFGLSFQGFSTDYVFTNAYGFSTQQQASNTEAAVYTEYKKVFKTSKGFERAVLEPSLRLHYYNNQNQIMGEPRFRGKLNFPGLSFSFATGLYSQNLMAAVSDRDVVNLFQGFLSAPDDLAFRRRNHNLQTSWHSLFGVEAEIIPQVTTTVEGWYKGFTQLTNINRDRIFQTDPEFVTETGEAYGIDVIVKYQTRNAYVYTNYGLAKVTRTDRLDSDDPRTYPPIFDRRHTANVVVAIKQGSFAVRGDDGQTYVRPKFNESPWEFSLRWSLGSGFPFTQTQGYFEKLDFLEDGAQTDITTQNGDLGLILSDDLNGGRLPYYHRLDLSVKRRWLFGNKVLMELAASAINTYNRRNIFYFDRIRFAPVYQLPVIPSLGVTVKY
ncbi:MAG: TonB-dependent receptor, partial [Bacteroidota bacterium]